MHTIEEKLKEKQQEEQKHADSHIHHRAHEEKKHEKEEPTQRNYTQTQVIFNNLLSTILLSIFSKKSPFLKIEINRLKISEK